MDPPRRRTIPLSAHTLTYYWDIPRHPQRVPISPSTICGLARLILSLVRSTHSHHYLTGLLLDIRSKPGPEYIWSVWYPLTLRRSFKLWPTAALALSSGTIGAALSSSLCMTRSIALSYGTVIYPIPATYHEPAHRLGCRIIQHIWHNWGQDKDSLRNGEVDLYSINIPLIDRLLTEEGLKIYWTNIWRNSYGRLFKAISAKPVPKQVLPDALANGQQQCENKTTIAGPTPADSGNLLFHWAPEMKGIIAPSPSMLPVGSDGWAIYHGYVSVTPLCANFGEPHTYQNISIEDRVWKIKL